jgi:hypothetical protein
MTISAEAQSIEDEIERLARTPSSPARAAGLAAVDRQLGSVVIPFDEWETLYRMRLQLGHMDDTAATPDEPIERPGSPREPRVERLFGIGYAAIVVVLLVIDVLVLLTGRRSDRAVRPRRLADP